MHPQKSLIPVSVEVSIDRLFDNLESRKRNSFFGKMSQKRSRILSVKNYIRNLAYEAEVAIFKRKKPTVFQSIVNKIALLGLRSSRHQEVYSPPHNSAIIDTVYLPGIGTSSSSPNISLLILIDTLCRTSHL